ncbi:MAG TPA: VOC family protein [Actinomycetota bacterium]|nr:VOC family protein [Actinomycetota bacterium]
MSSVEERTARATSTLVDRVAAVELRVTDVGRALEFYSGVVGLEVYERDERRATLGAPGGPALLTVRSDGVEGPAEPGATGLFHVAIRFPTRAALGDVLARLVAAGVEIGAGDHAVSEALYVDDPDGNGVELYRDRPVEQWPAPTSDALVPMVTEPVDLRGVLAEGAGDGAVGAPAARGTDVGHVHLQVADVERSVAFYVDELGLDLTARMGSQAAFFSSNAYHHHVGANSWRSRGGSPASSGRAGLDRIVFAVPGPERLERLRARLEARGHALAGDGGGVTVRDPDGVALTFVAA